MEHWERVVEWVAGDENLLAFVYPIAEGERTPPEGEIFEYGDNELAAWLDDIFRGKIPEGVNVDRVALNRARLHLSELWFSDATWANIRDGILRLHPKRVLCHGCTFIGSPGEVRAHERRAAHWNEEFGSQE